MSLRSIVKAGEDPLGRGSNIFPSTVLSIPTKAGSEISLPLAPNIDCTKSCGANSDRPLPALKPNQTEFPTINESFSKR